MSGVTVDLSYILNKAAAEALTAPLERWWLSFADGKLPVGSQFLGVTLVQANGFGMAVIVARARGDNPGGEVRGMAAPAHMGAPPDAMRNRLIVDKAELDRLTQEWTGQGVKSLAELEG